MAASSGGVEWTTIIKPILAATYGPFNKQDIPNFVKGIIKSEAELLNHEADYDSFYTAFSALAAESISSCADSLEKSQLGNACEATRILLQYLVSRLSRLLSDAPSDHGAFTTPQLARLLLLAIQGLCQGRSTMQYSDRHSLTSEMKVAKLPTHVKTSTPGEAPTQPEMLKRPRSDLTASVLEQLMTPLSPHPPTQATVSNVPQPETINTEQPNQTRNESTPDKKQVDNDQQIKNQFIRKNIKSLKALKAGDKIIEMCLNLTHLSPYVQKCKEDNAKHGTCNSQAEALTIKQNLSYVLSDVTFIAGALSLPVLEPLTLERISNLTLISRGCLSAAVSISTAVIVISCNSTTAKAAPGTTNQSRNEDEVDQNSIGLVEKSIEVFTLVSNAISNSKLAEKCVAQNHQMLGTAMLLQGLWYQLSAHAEKGKDEKGKSPSRTRESSSRINLLKIQQGFSILSVALASQALQLSASLMSDLEDEDSCNEPEIPVKVDIFGKYSPSQRVSYILSAAPIHQLLHYLAVISYRKAYTLKRVMKPATEEDTVSFSDSTIYNGDDFSFSDDSSGEEDEDSEPILGSWLEKTLATKAVPEVSEIDSEREEKPQPSNQQSNQSNQQTHQVSGGIVPEKGEPHGYITLATDIFEFLSTHFLSNNSSVVKTSIIANIGEQHMGILAAIIRDLDKESARTKTGTIPSYFGIALGSLYYKFSHFLTLYTHNLLATSVLSDTLQISLLNHLGVNPTPVDAPWPLMVYPRTLVALSQIIILKKQPEQETLILRIWNRAINMLTECIVNPPASSETEIEDLNAEHAQLLLFFFYSLSLLQKKSVLLSVSKALIRCGETIKTTGQLRESQLLHTARLLHIFEHLMRHLYDIPTVLVEQVKWNLFSATSLLANDNGAKSAKIASRMYCPSEDITDNLNKPSSQEESGMKPKFYSLTAVEMNHEETPKLDGLACNFILATPEKLKYPALIDALIDILGVINQCDSNWLKKGRSPNLSLLCAIQYCFMACWRMLLLLPPSSAFISQLGMNSETKDTPQLLYSLIWGPRTGCNVFSGYIKDNLVKQAMFTSNAETLLKTINSTMTSLHYTATLARNILANFKTKCALGTDTLQLSDLIILDVMVAKLLVHLHDQKSGQTSSTLETAISLLPDILSVFHYVTRCTRNGLVAYIEEGNTETSLESQGALLEILAITSQQATQTKTLTSGLRALLPANVRSNVERWNSTKASYTPSNAFTNDPIPSECHILTVLKVHISKLYRSELFINNESLKHLMHALVAFTGELMSKLPEEDNALRQQIVSALLPTSLDSCSEYLHEVVLHSILDPQNEDQQREAYCEVLRHCYNLLINESQTPLINDKILQECLKIMETLLDSQIGCVALHNFFTTKSEQKVDLIKILMSVQTMKSNQSYSSCIHKFFNKLFSAAEKNPGGVLEQLCAASLAGLAVVDRNELCDWLHYLLLGQFKLDSPEVGPEEMELEQEESPPTFENAALVDNQQLLKYLTSYIVKDTQNGDTVATSILEALIPIGSRLLSLDLAGTGFSDVMQIMVTLANSGSRKGHTHLFFAATLWLQQWKDYILETRMLQQIKEEGVLQGRCRDVVEAVGQLLSYVADVTAALGSTNNLASPPGNADRPQSPTTWDVSGELSPDKLDCDWLEELAAEEEEDSLGDDSDEDSLCSKLCTFTMTQKEFMNQHWYHCHTCKMVDGVGVCSICARVCHKSHDVTYAKYGNFFCDCGAKDDGSCLALVKRSPLSSDDVPMPMQSSAVDHVMIRRTPSSPAPDRSDKNKDEKFKQRSALAKQLESCSEALMHHAEASPIINSLLELSCLLLNAVKASCEKNSSVGCHHRAQNALQRLHEDAKQFESTDQLMMPTLGSQEGAFENVRSNYPGDQGQTIRQLLSAHMIRRVAMCCLSSPQGKRQHLAVSHEKGKITVLQLSALLKQADSSKRKLTLTRLASAPIPFTVLSITGNPCNEDFLAVCGLKDCHVLTFSSGGTVVQHLVLHPQLETGNYIIRAIWLPGSQTQLALITADFIKIYDLSKDALSPQYYFLVPSGKIRDATFVFQEYRDPCLLVMSSAGYIYSQGMCEESSAEHGLFYVTNTLEVNHPEIKDVGGLLGGGGVSIYYSHTLQLLFFSFSQGKSFIAPLKSLDSFELPTVFQIQLTNKSSTNGSSKSSSQSQQAQPLCEWSEVPNHPGLVCSVLQASNNPVILMIKPDTVLVQEIKVVPAKAKILDMVAIRHASSSSELRTTLILLCEDGSLRIYMAGQDQTGYWLSPAMQASNPLTSALRTGKKKKTNKSSKQSGASSAPNFPIDFFEHCQLLGDIEYGGNDVLEVYNSEQIKTRLAKQGQYILNTRPAGFTLEINNTDASCVITGIRIFVGSQDPIRSPAYVEILGRSIQLNITSSRWFDYPLTREESLQADRKLSVTFGPSQDPDCVTMVDSILVYGKTKDSFGWPEESEEVAASSANGAASSSTSDNDNNQSSLQQMSVLDKAMAGILEVLDGCFTVFDFSDDKQQQQKSIAINVATNLLTLPTPNSIQFCAKSLLASLHSSKVGYHQFKDQAILKYVTEILSDFDKITSAIDIDSELFYRLVLMTRSIAAARPYNLTKIAETLYKGKDKNFMTHLLDNFWRLHAAKPNNIVLAPVCVPGLTHIETTVHAVVEIINAFTYSDLELVPQAAQLYLKLLLCEDTNISFSGKQALIRVLRPRQRQQPKVPAHCTTPPTTTAPPLSQPSQDEESHAEPVDAIEPIAMLEEAGAAGVANPIEALLGAGAFPPLLDIPPDSVDETMVELAIALSLQEHDSVANLLSVQQNLQQGLQNLSGQALQSLQALATQAQPGPSHEPGHLSDTTASAGGSDDEGSTAATDGSTLRTSPAEQGWESGGSGADSISCETFERYAVTRSTSHGASPGSSKCDSNHPPQENCYNCMQMKEVRLRFTERLLLEKLLAFLPQLKQVGGVQAIPFLQVILILTSDLEGDDQYDRNCLDRLLSALVSELGMRDPVDVNAASECQRTPQLEVHLVMMRFLSVLMSRAKSTSKNSNESDHFVSQTTASTLMDNSVVQYCLGLLKGLLMYWKNQNTNQESASGSGALGGSLLKSQPNLTPPDMSPFFLKLYVKGLGGDVFESYPQLLTEMALRLPYQVLKHADNPLSTINEVFGDEWNFYLCEYMMTNQTPFVRRQVRKLLMFLCGNKDKYRRSRDFHALECHTREIIKVCHEAGLESTTPLNISLAYDQLVELMEHLKSCLEIATSRPNNWQNFCMYSETLVPFLFKASCALDEGVCPTILQLLQNAFGKVQSNKEREKSVESDTNEKDNCSVLVRYITENIPSDIVSLFVKTFLLETNSTAVRWQAHDLVQSLHFNSDPTDQETLKDLLWTFWPQLGTYGRKAAQFVDLLGYFSIKSTDNGDKIQDMVDLAVNSLKTQNQILAEHPNTNLYGKLSQFIELDGYYFETRSCLVCNNPEVPLSSIKLSAIKVDSKFTTTTQIVKLVSSHSISKITLRIGDLKRAKMVRSINIYYNNRSVQAVVELKNKPAMWNKAKKVVLTSGQTEVKVDFPLPIVACNLMIEYSDFYENIQASSETLQCPRCGVSVPANPGVCGNCGENVFQCHKCRAINYDEKDPFLCHSCGFCKYAKFEYTLTARPCCAVDPIENDEDRKKTLNSISTMQERADRIYKQLSTIRPNVEVILQSIEEGQGAQEEGASTGSSNSTHVKQRINLLAQRYCVDCKSSFEELGKISQKVMACRAEIVAYDRKQREDQHVPKRNRFLTIASKDCYGCASSTSEHCLTILKALSTISGPKQVLRSSGLINELVEKNLARKSSAMQEQVKHLLCLLAKDQPIATEELCDLLMTRIMTALANHKVSSYASLSVHPEMALLSSLIATEDSCWEQKLKCIVKLYLQACKESKSPSVTEDIVMPCLKILIGLMIPTSPTSQANKDKTIEDLCRILPSEENKVSVHKWLQNDPKYSFKSWLQRMPQKSENSADSKPSKEETRAKYLTQKYSRRWKQRMGGKHIPRLRLSQHSWLKLILFNKSSRVARQSACKLLETMFQNQVPQRKQELLDLLTSYLGELGDAGETSSEFLALYRTLMQPDGWKRYLALKGTLVKIADLITKEIEQLHQLEDTSLVSDLTDGFALKMLTELLSCFLEHDAIKRLYKGRLVGAVLNGYLALRRLAVQRTRLIDETQEKLFELLEEMTSGTETETKDFMKICIEAVERCEPEDDLTPVFILERLCTIISPEENDIGEFFLTLEKDPQQEDFLQGRMLGNPYSSTEPGLGPLMRDVKNKICQDCELVALLEDDNGMELLVNNKIISLDLPVREVYKKVWMAEGEGEAMRVVYRMRGLLGDATEEFIETLDNKSKQQVNNEEVYKMANVMTECRGLEITLQRLAGVSNVVRTKPLLQVLLRLLLLCTKVRSNQEKLAHPDLGAIEVLLSTVQRCIQAGKNADSRLTEQILDILETILTIAAAQPLQTFLELAETFGGPDHIQALLACASPPPGGAAVSASLLQHLGKVLAALTYGHEERMQLLTSHFASVLNFESYDASRTSEDEQKMELFCLLAAGIDRSPAGNTLKDHIHTLGLVKRAAEYISVHAPPTTPLLLLPDNDDWKEFIARPSLKVILRFLAGLATEHEPTQLEVATPECIAVLHRLEQVSSQEHVGSLSENLLEALRTNPAVAAKVEQVRQQTRAEKKRLAMAMREKQLGALGMKANEKGQVVARSSLLTQLEELGEETGLTCVICREGYRCQPAKVLGIYTYTKRCPIEDVERKQRRTLGYTTVTHFNVVHIDCHMAAVRQARARDEWESAALQNANTKCNGLLPLWGPSVPESAFASCLARHNTYLQECTGHRDIGYGSTVHDLKLLLLRFSHEKPFNEDAGGGGPESNMHLLGYLVHMALYVLNTTRSAQREDKSLTSYLAAGTETWVSSSFIPDGPLYWACMSLLLRPTNRWQQGERLAHLRRILVLSHARHTEKVPDSQPAKPPTRLSDITPQDYTVYKPYLIFFGLVDGMYRLFFKKVGCGGEEQWPSALADFIRHNDEVLLRASDQLLAFYTEELLPCASFDEFCDVLGLLGEVDDPATFLVDVLRGVGGG